MKKEPVGDLTLCKRCQRGDVHALEELYKRHKDKVYALALRLTNNVQDAEDIVQDVFIQVYRKIGNFRGDAAFTSWLYRIATNISISALRRRKRIQDDLDGRESEIADGKLNARNVPVLRPFLERAIASLPPKSRMVFVLHDIQGFQHSEIAEMMDCSEGTSKSQLHKARAQLRKVLTPQLRNISSLVNIPVEQP